MGVSSRNFTVKLMISLITMFSHQLGTGISGLYREMQQQLHTHAHTHTFDKDRTPVETLVLPSFSHMRPASHVCVIYIYK